MQQGDPYNRHPSQPNPNMMQRPPMSGQPGQRPSPPFPMHANRMGANPLAPMNGLPPQQRPPLMHQASAPNFSTGAPLQNMGRPPFPQQQGMGRHAPSTEFKTNGIKPPASVQLQQSVGIMRPSASSDFRLAHPGSGAMRPTNSQDNMRTLIPATPPNMGRPQISGEFQRPPIRSSASGDNRPPFPGTNTPPTYQLSSTPPMPQQHPPSQLSNTSTMPQQYPSSQPQSMSSLPQDNLENYMANMNIGPSQPPPTNTSPRTRRYVAADINGSGPNTAAYGQQPPPRPGMPTNNRMSFQDGPTPASFGQPHFVMNQSFSTSAVPYNQQATTSDFQMQQQQQAPQFGNAMGQVPQFGNAIGQSPQFRPQHRMSNAGVAQTPKSRIDPDQIPSPLAVQEADQLQYDSVPYNTMSRNVPPLASTHYRTIDGGNANPRLMRMTAYNIPTTDEITASSGIPLGMLIQPLADLSPDEAPVPVVDFGESGPIRCKRCLAYINPFCAFTNGGNTFICNLCKAENDVPREYFCNIDMNGRRVDVESRPELQYGTVEFIASKDYIARPPAPISYIFAIDVTFHAIQSGLVGKCTEAIKYLLYGGGKTLPQGTKIGIITFDRSIHFYNLKSSLEQPHMMVVPDIEEAFIPLSEGFLVDPTASRPVIESLLASLPGLFQDTKINESALGSVCQVVHSAMKDTGGKLVVVQSIMPTYGPGALKNREDPKLYGTDKEKTLFEPQDFFWRKMAQNFATSGICLDLFLAPSSYIDIASVGSIASVTGGNIYNFPNFEAYKDGIRFVNDFYRNLVRTFGYDALMRVRCSNGLKITDHHGSFYMRNTTDIELAGLDSETAFGVAFKHDAKLDEKSEAAFQCAVLYTTAEGFRRIRVINMSLPCSSTLSMIFRFTEMDTTINFLAKACIGEIINAPIKNVRDQITARCVKILAAYRKFCASSSTPGQLILPESYKLYPLLALSLLKNKAFRMDNNMSSDERVYAMRHLKSMGISESVIYLYPRLFCITELEPSHGTISPTGKFIYPKCIRASIDRLNQANVYLIENGQKIMVWIGKMTPPEFLQQLFGAASIEAIDVRIRALPELKNPLSEKFRAIVSRIQQERSRFCQIQLVRQQMDAYLETEFASMLVEDKHMETLGYVDYLCAVHKNIQMEVGK